MHFGLTTTDFVVIITYFAIIIGIGIWSSRRIKNQEDYFLAGRRFGKFIQTFTAFGSGTNVESPVGVATTTFTNGTAGIWSSLTFLFVTPIYWLIAPWMRRVRVLTMADYLRERYGSQAIAGLYTLVAATVLMTHLSVGFHAASKTILALTPKESYEQLSDAEKIEYRQAQELQELRTRDYHSLTEPEKKRFNRLERNNPRMVFSYIDKDWLIWIIAIVVIIYGVAGGLEAAALSDALQGMCIICMSLILFPFCWAKINMVYGGEGVMNALRTVHVRLPESFFHILGSPALMDFTWFYVVALSLMTVCNTPAQAHFLTSTAAAKNEFVCRFGATWGSYIKRFCAVLWGFFALCALTVFHDKIHDSDLMWGYATRELLQPVGFGLVGLMIACLMAALMSTADMMMLSGSALLTRNVYRPLLPRFSEKHYIYVGRFLGVLVVVVGALVATLFDNIWQQLKLMLEINVIVAATWWLGMKWRRANRRGAWASMTTAAICFFLLPLLLPILVPSLKTNEYLLKTTHTRHIVQIYRAHEMDVEARNAEIEVWEKLSAQEQAAMPQPAPLIVGEEFTKNEPVPAKSIFWTLGIKDRYDGSKAGSGMLNLELVALDCLGLDLSANTYAMNETIRILIRATLPFLVMIIVSFFTRPLDKNSLDRFFVKMLTPVKENHAEDARELQLSYAQPDRFNHRKVFPRSNWEFEKWDRTDTIGFLLAVACVFAVLGFLKILLLIGA
ncbi:MAG: sodium:solute symporter family protein [Sedimentisphaerales bacterium]|nr:sodium:solute symporter family protein [Sedimentisphaerales bacterium]